MRTPLSANPQVPPRLPDPLARRFVRLAVPNILANLTVPLAGLVDTAMLGNFAEISDLSGVALGTVIFDYVYWSFGFLRMSTTGLTAQAAGREDRQEVSLIALRGGVLALGIGLAILLLQGPLGELGFALLEGSGTVKTSGREYFDARIWGAPAALVNFVLLGWFLGRERAGWVLLIALVGNGANILLDYVFIVHFGWGSRGAGLATMGSQYLMLALALLLMRRELGALLRRRSHLRDLSALRRLMALNGDIMIRTFALLTAFALFQSFASGFGEVDLAAAAILLKVLSLAAFFIDGYAFATESLAGIYHGRGDLSHLAALLRLAVLAAVGTGLVFALTFVLLPSLFTILTHHQAVLVPIEQDVAWLLPVLALGAVAYVLDGYFLGLTAGRILRNAQVLALAVGFLPLAWIARELESRALLWAAMTAFMAARVVTLGRHVPATLRGEQGGGAR